MSSTENKTTLNLIQQEIQDLMERERELKNYYNKQNGTCDLDNKQNGFCDTNIQENGICEVDHNENSTWNLDADVGINGNENSTTTTTSARPPLLRANSTSVLKNNISNGMSNGHTKPSFRRFVSASPSTKGVMQRFLKSRGKVQAVSALTMSNGNANYAPTANSFQTPFAVDTLQTYEILPPKLKPGQSARKGFVSAEQKIQRDIADTYKRETELKTLRQSQGNLTLLDDDILDAPLPNYMGGLRGSKSMAQLYNSLDEPCVAAASAPCSLKPARSLAELCDAKDDGVTSSQTLIMRFEQMIEKNRESKRT